MTMNVANLSKKYQRACLLLNEGDLLMAQVGLEVLNAAADEEQAREFLKAAAPIGLGLSPARAGKLIRMGRALHQLSDETLWRAAGWEGIRGLLKTPKKGRNKAAQAILKEANGGELAKKRVTVLVSSVNPKAYPKRKPAAKPTPAPVAKPVATVDNSDHVLAEELRRLVADPLIGPALLAHLSAKAAKLVAPKSSKKSA